MTADCRKSTVDRFEADLHIHTLLSPCAEVEMIPSLIIEAALRAGLQMIAITDHNSCENAGAVIKAAEGTGLKVVPGIEVNSVEGVHLLCLFDSLEQTIALQESVYATLLKLDAASRYYKQQMIVDERDEFVRYCETPIALPTKMDVNQVHKRVKELGGLLIPSHIDRHESGMCGILGILPEKPYFDGVEISRNIDPEDARYRYPSIGKRAIFMDSDSHCLNSIGERRTALYIKHRTVEEIRLACHCEGGRRVGDA